MDLRTGCPQQSLSVFFVRQANKPADSVCLTNAVAGSAVLRATHRLERAAAWCNFTMDSMRYSSFSVFCLNRWNTVSRLFTSAQPQTLGNFRKNFFSKGNFQFEIGPKFSKRKSPYVNAKFCKKIFKKNPGKVNSCEKFW